MRITNQNPQSPKITVYATRISSATVTCTTEEKESMKAEVTSMESAIASVATVLTAIQEQIESMIIIISYIVSALHLKLIY